MSNLTTWAAEVLASNLVQSAERDFLFSNEQKGDLASGHEKIHRIERALQLLAEATDLPPEAAMAFALRMLLGESSWMGAASDNWGRARTLAARLLVRHGSQKTLVELETRLPVTRQPYLLEDTITALRRGLAGLGTTAEGNKNG